jgi:hypothetical protein
MIKKYSTYYIQKNKKYNKRFISWINKVEKSICKKYKLNLLDLPDQPYMILFEKNISPNKVISIISFDIEKYLI